MAADITTFVPHHVRLRYEEKGWEYIGRDDGVSALYVWRGKGAPVFPDALDWITVGPLTVVLPEDFGGWQ